MEPPDSLEAAEVGIRKFEDFLVSMENNQDKVLSPVDSGNKLVAEENLYSDKILEKVQLIEDRYSLPPRSQGRYQVGLVVSCKVPRLSAVLTTAFGFPSRHRKNKEKAEEASVILKDNLELQHFLQNCQEVRLQQGRPLCRRFPSRSKVP